jgi:hypothetical protein
MSFKNWIKRHRSRFQRLENYFENDPSIIDDWYRVLERFDPEDLNAATDMMMLQEATVWPDQQLGMIKRYAHRSFVGRNIVAAAPQPSYRSAYRCLECKDTGMVRVLCVEPAEFTTFSALKSKNLRDCNTACVCAKGKRLTNRENGRSLPEITSKCYRYDYDFDWHENVQLALKYFAGFVESKKFPEFTKFAS